MFYVSRQLERIFIMKKANTTIQFDYTCQKCQQVIRFEIPNFKPHIVCPNCANTFYDDEKLTNHITSLKLNYIALRI